METKELNKEIEVIKTEVTTQEEQAQALQVIDAESNANAAEVLGYLAARRKDAEKKRKFFVDPLNAQVKNINAMFKPEIEKIKGIETIIKNKVGAYHLAEEEKRAKEQARLDKIRAAADAKREAAGKEVIAEPVRTVAEKEQTTQAATGSVTVKKVWKHEIVDATILPQQYKDLIMAEAIKKGIADTIIRKFVNAGVHEIDGVKIYQTTQVATRT